MAASIRSDLKSLVAGFLVVLAALASGGRGIAAAPPPVDLGFAIEAAAAPICHAGRHAPGPADPAHPADHDCCTACALATAVLPSAPQASPPVAAPLPVGIFVAGSRTPAAARAWSPQWARGPPGG